MGFFFFLIKFYISSFFILFENLFKNKFIKRNLFTLFHVLKFVEVILNNLEITFPKVI